MQIWPCNILANIKMIIIGEKLWMPPKLTVFEYSTMKLMKAMYKLFDIVGCGHYECHMGFCVNWF